MMSTTTEFNAKSDKKYTENNISTVNIDSNKQMLEIFCDEEDAIHILQNFNSYQVSELINILVNVINNHQNYHTPILQPVYYEDSDEIAYINVIFDNCNWDEWKELELEFLYQEDSTKGSVAVICAQGLTE